LYRCAALALVGASISLGGGCSKKGTEQATGADATAVQAAQALPEGTNVLAALDQKDYETAVSGLAKMREAVTGGDQETQFITLKQHVKNRLIEASATDPKAADALNALRMLTQGR
jgi:hypothetical protein